MTPKFECGDRVRWASARGQEGVITDGPFRPGVSRALPSFNADTGAYWDTYTYVVRFFTDILGARLLGEEALAPSDQAK